LFLSATLSWGGVDGWVWDGRIDCGCRKNKHTTASAPTHLNQERLHKEEHKERNLIDVLDDVRRERPQEELAIRLVCGAAGVS
jgi:hypothetical protein